MINFLKKNKIVIMLSTLIVTLTSAIIVSSLAWFTQVNDFQPTDVKSSVITSYFHDGTGTKDDPYVITTPMHYYNMVYLHGTSFNGGFTKDTYFQLGAKGLDKSKPNEYKFYYYDSDGVLHENEYSNYLNMNYYKDSKALKPLGSPENPFVSNIDGKNLTVTNLHITGRDTSDIGVFGFVDTSAKIHNFYIDGLDIDIANSQTNVASCAQHEMVHTSNTNVGFVAGHIASENNFSDVYVNHCQIRNSVTNEVENVDDYGLFGFCDQTSKNQTGGESYHYALDGSTLHNYFEDRYSTVSGQALSVRDTEYSSSAVTGTVSSAITKNDDTYSFVGDKYQDTSAERNYSFGTVGSKEASNNYDLYNYDKNNTHNYSRTFDVNTSITTTAPEDAQSTGAFMYWDETNSKWIYYTTQRSGEQVAQNFNCFTISYYSTADSCTKYLKYTASGLGYDSTVPLLPEPGDSASQISTKVSNYGDYYFVLKPNQASLGVDKIADGVQGDYYIFNPKNNVYLSDKDLNMTQTSSDNKGVFSTDFSDAILFTITGRTEAYIKYVRSVSNDPNTVCGLVYGHNYKEPTLKKVTNGDTPLIPFTFNTIAQNTEEDDDPDSGKYSLVTDISKLNNGSKVALLADDNTSHYVTTSGEYVYEYNTDLYTYKEDGSGNPLYEPDVRGMSTAQGANNRGATSIINFSTDSGEDQIEGTEDDYYYFMGGSISGIAIFTVGKPSSGIYTFYDPSNTGYLAATTTKNRMITIEDGENAYAQWSISMNATTGKCDITTQGSTSYSNMFFNYSATLFSCYNTLQNSSKIHIWKLDSNSSGKKYTSNAVAVSFVADGGGTFTHTDYDVYYAPLGGDASTRKLLNLSPARVAGWIFATNSFVSLNPELRNGWYLVEDTVDIEAGAHYLIANANHTDSGVVAGSLHDSHYLNIVSSTFDLDNKTCSPGDGYEEFVLGGTSGNYTLQAVSNSKYLSFTAASNNSVAYSSSSDSNNEKFNIFFSDDVIKMQNVGTSYYMKYNSSAPRFSSYNDTMTAIKLYRFYEQSTSEPVYFADEYKSSYNTYYDRNHIDLVGNADINESYITLDSGAVNNMPSIKHLTENSDGLGEFFYPTKYTSDSIVIIVPNNGSLDFGTLTVTCNGSNVPAFIKGNDFDGTTQKKSLGFNDVNCSDDDASSNQSYRLSLNPYNIFKLCYCTLDANGEILSAYDSNGIKTNPSYTIGLGAIENFVLVLSAPHNSAVNISSVDIQFTSVIGNAGDFGTVGYRSATYSTGGSDAGNTITSGTVDGNIISFTFTMPSSTANVYVKVEYSGGDRYDIYFYSSEACTLYVFNYDAENASVYVTSTGKSALPYKETFNEISISAGTPPGGWNPSYSPILTH